MIERIFTIGAYGFDQKRFLKRLADARIDLFLDIRARRGMRGPLYAFANAARLEQSLADAGIPYTHVRDVAPTPEIREAQHAVDDRQGVARRQREILSPEFVRAYTSSCLRGLDAQSFVADHCGDSRRPVLFCVEREPAACHRSLLAKRLARDLSITVQDLMP